MAVSANWLHSPSRLCHREGAFTQFTFQNGQESRKWLTIQICHVLNAWEAKKPLYGTKNLSKGAKTRVRVLADIQNFALRAHCVRTACMAFPWLTKQGYTRTIAIKQWCWYDGMIKVYDLCEYIGIPTAEHCCICIPEHAFAERFLTCMRP